MKALVTGGTGFIGSNLVKKLIDLKWEVLITGTPFENPVPNEVKILGHYFSDIHWNDVDKVDVLFHQGARNDTLDFNEQEMMLSNVQSPKLLFQHLLDLGCKNFVYASSTAVYGNSPAPYVENETPVAPLNPYGKSKAIFDEFAMEFGEKNDVNVVGLRYCNVYGPLEFHKDYRASMIYHLFKQMNAGKRPMLFRDGTQRRDWCYVDDVVRANLLSSQFDGVELFNIGSGNSVSFNDLVLVLNSVMNSNLEIEYIENPYKKTYQSYTECCVEKARKLLGWEPQYNIQTGIEEYLRLI
jgi:ADP-L-glycero-D-manno-heptose 6-epimerase